MPEPRNSDQPEDQPTNRAERRAAGKKKPAQQWPDQQQHLHGRVANQSRRQYGNRRTG